MCLFYHLRIMNLKKKKKNHESQKQPTTWINHEDTRLSEISQTQTNTV